MFSLQAPHSLVYMIRMKKRDKGWIRIPNSQFNRKCAGSSLPFSVRGRRLRKGQLILASTQQAPQSQHASKDSTICLFQMSIGLTQNVRYLVVFFTLFDSLGATNLFHSTSCLLHVYSGRIKSLFFTSSKYIATF